MLRSKALGYLALGLWMAGCGSAPPPPVAMAPTQSAHFSGVSEHLHLGGLVYTYMDIDGDAAAVSDFFFNLLEKNPDLVPAAVTQRLKAAQITSLFGLEALRAIGFSSFVRGDHIHNVGVLRMQENKGVMRIYGDEAHPLTIFDMAPADTDLAFEQPYNLKVIYDLIVQLSERGVGLTKENLAEMRKERLGPLDITAGDIIDRANTKISVIASIDETKPITIPDSSVRVPFTNFLIQIDNMGFVVDAFAKKAAEEPFARVEREGDWLKLSAKMPLPAFMGGYAPMVLSNKATGHAYIVSHPAFLMQCLATNASNSLRSTAEFATAMQDLPVEGLGGSFMSSQATRVLQATLDQLELEKAIIEEKGARLALGVLRFLLPEKAIPVGAIVTGGQRSLMMKSNLTSSQKLYLFYINPAITGSVLALILPTVAEMAKEEGGLQGPF